MEMKFLKGQRVAVYGWLSPKEGGIVKLLNGACGTIIRHTNKNGLEVLLDIPFDELFLSGPGVVDHVHPKQVRRLHSRKKNEG